MMEASSAEALRVSGFPIKEEWSLTIRCQENAVWSPVIPLSASQTRVTLSHVVCRNQKNNQSINDGMIEYAND